MKTKARKPAPTPTLAELLDRAHVLADDYFEWERRQSGDRGRFYPLMEMIVPGVLCVEDSQRGHWDVAMNALKAVARVAERPAA